MKKQKLLFVCTHNSARSQMAEGIANHYLKDYQAFSGGTEQTYVKELAITVMTEIGIDISQHTSKLAEIFYEEEIDVVVTVCDDAKEACPYFPFAKKQLHKSFADPSDVEGTYDDRLTAFRTARDEIKTWILATFT